MLVFALAVVLFAYAAVGLGLKGKLPSGLPGTLLIFAVLMLAAHRRSGGSRRTPTRCCCRWPRC